MKIAVTGAAGFIGRYVLRELSKHSIDVVAVVRNIETSEFSSFNGEIIQYDLAQASDNTFEELGRPDVLIHLAWGGLPNYKSLHHFEEELPKQYTFLSKLIRSGLSRLVVAGTCFEYGMLSGELSESMMPQPANPYGYAKNALRCQLEYLQSIHPFSLAWARLFYLYGDGQSSKSLFSQFQTSVKNQATSFDMSHGEQLRDYLHVRDVALYLVKLALSDQNIGLINICSGKPISVRRLVEQWVEDSDWKIRLNLGYYPYPEYEPMAFWGDQQKITLTLT